MCWRPELDLNGEYHIDVLNYLENFNLKTNVFDANVNWEQPYLTFTTKKRLELVVKLEQLMEQLPVYNDPRILEKRGIVDEPSESYRIRLQEVGLEENLIKQILKNGNSKIQNIILDHKGINRDIILQFVENGVNKKVKNKAGQKLNSKTFRK